MSLIFDMWQLAETNILQNLDPMYSYYVFLCFFCDFVRFACCVLRTFKKTAPSEASLSSIQFLSQLCTHRYVDVCTLIQYSVKL